MARPASTLQLTLATGAFAVCFAVFGSVSAMMPILAANLGLRPVQVSLAIALPVLLGSLGRIPLGILTDRLHGVPADLDVHDRRARLRRGDRDRQRRGLQARPYSLGFVLLAAFSLACWGVLRRQMRPAAAAAS